MANTANTAATTSAAQDPFAGQRTENNDPFAESAEKTTEGNVSTDADLGAEPPTNRTGGSPSQDRRMSKEWGMHASSLLTLHFASPSFVRMSQRK